MTSWRLFCEIRKNIKNKHDLDFRVLFSKPNIVCATPILGVFFFEEGTHCTLILNDSMRSYLQCCMFSYEHHDDATILNIWDKSSDRAQSLIVLGKAADVDIAITDNYDCQIPASSLHKDAGVTGEPHAATLGTPRYLLKLSKKNFIQWYTTTTCAPSAEEDWAKTHFKWAQSLELSDSDPTGEPKATYHISPNMRLKEIVM